tara:strand:- start:851 stop:1222 length:372 start_codon:yes stop_codon:yes gene_type:complete
MSYADTIQQILSDGRWHCVLDLIAETGLSARNRISELNKDHEEKYAKKRYIGEKCKLESCQHRSELYMYKLNTSSTESQYEKQISYLDFKYDEMQEKEMEDWNNKTPEERHEHIKNLKKNFGL